MTSKIKVDNINKVSDDSNIIKKCGTTTTIGSGASNPIVVDGSAVTLGRCGGTVALASGATQTGFGRTGTVDWQTGSIKTSTFTAANGEGYFANTSGGAFTMNLPAGSAGNIVSVVDYTNTFQTNNLTVTPNGSQKIGGTNASATLSTEGQSVTFVYVDDTEGWKNVQDSTSNAIGQSTISATGGTITTSGDYKIHTFTGPGTFCVSSISTTTFDNTIGYQVVAGGAGGGFGTTGGGGAGGFREGRNGPMGCFAASPLVANAPTNAITLTAQAYPITVGAGGTGATGAPGKGSSGANSIFSSITSTGGGGGASDGSQNGNSGGSGGGGANGGTGANGNTPPVSPSQGNPGASTSTSSPSGGGGGGAGGNGSANSGPDGGPGGAGVASSITGSPVARAGGGGGGSRPGSPTSGGTGGGGAGGNPSGAGGDGTANTGGGGGSGKGCEGGPAGNGKTGGSGIVIIRYKFQ